MMSSSSRFHGEVDNSKVELPVFISPNELIFALNKKRSMFTIFNPYENEAQFRIMTTNPDRFDVSVIKGVIKPRRRIDVTIRLLSQKIPDVSEPTDDILTIDYFKITLQVGTLKGNKTIKVNWCSNADLSAEDSHVHLSPGVGDDSRPSKYKIKSSKLSSPSPSLQMNPSPSSISYNQRLFSNQRSSSVRPGRQVDHSSGGSNVNLVCTLCAIACVLTLFLPLSVDFELCKKTKSILDQPSTSFLSQIGELLSVSYEMKLGCSFALGLFTYRLISTLPD